MAEAWEHVIELLRSGLESAATDVSSRLDRSVDVVQAKPPDSGPLLRFDVSFGEQGVLSWFISHEDATGFSDMLIGGDGDRGATLTEMHLDALSAAFSSMLEAGVDGMNARLAERVEAGGIDMKMEDRLPVVDSGGVQALYALNIAGFGALTVAQQATNDLVNLLGERLLSDEGVRVDPAEAPASAPGEGEQPAAADGDAEAGTPAGGGADAGGSATGGRVVEMPQRQPASGHASGGDRDLEMLLNVPLNVTVELGRTKRSVQQLLDMNIGSILELGKLAGDPMDILVNGKVLARGEVVVIDEEFGIRITEILTPEQRLRRIS